MSESEVPLIRLHLDSGEVMELRPVWSVPDWSRRGWLNWREEQAGVQRSVTVKTRRIVAFALSGIDSADLYELEGALAGRHSGRRRRNSPEGQLLRTAAIAGVVWFAIRAVRRRRAHATDEVA